MPKPWDRQPGEPAEWHQRFLSYLRMGPGRSVEEAWRKAVGAGPEEPLDPAWAEMARAWRWAERAAAYDAAAAAGLLETMEEDDKYISRIAKRAASVAEREVLRLEKISFERPLSDEELERMIKAVRLLAAARELARTEAMP